MTSRPMPVIKSSENNVIDFNHHLRCIGFIDDNIPKFVEKYFTQAKRGQSETEFVTLLQSNRNIWAISHVPVSLELLCYSWLKKKVQGQSTISSLYTDVVKNIFSTVFDKKKGTE
ncbi:hypothetical protein AKO1_006786, partial [Acrasis kona]